MQDRKKNITPALKALVETTHVPGLKLKKHTTKKKYSVSKII